MLHRIQSQEENVKEKENESLTKHKFDPKNNQQP